ncbi:hypothetical protein M3J09_010162 [Ascochyta lentis]
MVSGSRMPGPGENVGEGEGDGVRGIMPRDWRAPDNHNISVFFLEAGN